MAFFNDLIETIEGSPSGGRLRASAGTASVLAYAPRRLRADKPEAKSDAEIAYWRGRALRAETDLKTLETRVQRIIRALKTPRA